LTDFRKYSNIDFHKNPSYGSRIVPCGHMDGRTDGHADIAWIIDAFCNFPKAPDKSIRICATGRLVTET